MLGSTALAVPPIGGGVGVGAGASGSIRAGVPAIGVPAVGAPSINHPPLSAPPVNVPQPHANSVPPANVNASAHANANSAVVAGLPLHGTVTALSGTTVTIKFASGASRTYNVSAATATALQSSLHKSIAFTAQNDVLVLTNGSTTNPPLHGTLSALNGSSAVVKLANGATRTFTVTSEEAAQLKGRVGKRIAFWTNATGTLTLDKGRHH
jgi:hypothetical protein